MAASRIDRPRPELWGGHEPTVVRVRYTWRDQTRLTGHQDRIEDLARFADLGIRRLRYPVLWERVAPDRPGVYDWRWSDERLDEIERLGMKPIVGLLHHGSGPRYTNLLDPDLPKLFADFVGAAAARYPHVTNWVPVNEPVTTARFAGLYGHWYPHGRNEGAFLTALVTQVEAVAAAMQAIRDSVPHARLIQTEDLGRTWSVDRLWAKAEYYNRRRWLGWDLLTGTVTSDHPLYPDFERFNLGSRVSALAARPTPPDVLGVNHYVTSDRFLDKGRDDELLPDAGFRDETAARVMNPASAGLDGVLREAWARYAIPLAVTESHLGCTREEQLRWVSEGWETCRRLTRARVPVEGFTLWSLLGAVDWDSMITRDAGHYESGVFDVRGPTPRPTALAALAKSLASGERFALDHLLATKGWWHRPLRLEHRPWPDAQLEPETIQGRPILITGATGTLGRAFIRQCRTRGLAQVATTRAQLDIGDEAALARLVEAIDPWAIVNAAGWVRVDDAELEPEACTRANRDGAALIARAAARHGIRHVAFSSDLVFDGRRDRAYVEDDDPAPLNVYGRSKAEAEVLILKHAPASLVVRTAAFFSPDDPYNFARYIEDRLSAGDEAWASPDHVVSPTYVGDLVDAALDLLIDGERGIWHLANDGAVDWHGFGCRIATALSLDAGNCRPALPDRLGWRAERPGHAPLASARGQLLPTLADAIVRHAQARSTATDVRATTAERLSVVTPEQHAQAA